MNDIEKQVDWITAHCLEKNGSTSDYKVEWGMDRFMISSKMFASIGTHKDGRPILSLKCDPAFNQLVRQQNENIISGYYMNKEHWNSIYLDSDVPSALITEMLDMSYDLIFKSLTKKQQLEILG